ncbi:MAG: zf-HC2 domain-containing protein [Eubacteriales bacterium]|nr:zf-HC2 domain-containing protein [Eubacteriales bacterium]
MKISCDIIRDLLPLYAENMTSRASNDMVDEHLRACDGCRQFLSDLRRPAEFDRELPVHTLTRVKKAIRKRRILTALLAVLILVSLYVNVETVLNARVYLTAGQAVEKVEQREDGTIEIFWKDHVNGMNGTIRDESPGNMGFVYQTRLRNLLFPGDKTGQQTSILAKDSGMFAGSQIDQTALNIWYYSFRDGKPEQLLWDGGAEKPGPDFSFLDRVHYRIAYYCIAAAVLSALLAVLAWKKRGSGAGEWLRFGALFFGCSCAAVLCTSGGQFMDYWNDIPTKIIDSVYPFIPMLLTGLCAFSLYDMKDSPVGEGH